MKKMRPSLHLDLVLLAIFAVFSWVKSDDGTCGFTSPLHSGCKVTSITIQAGYGANKLLRNYETVNVTGYRPREGNPHIEYINGTFDEGNNDLAMFTSDSFPNFIKEQDMTTIDGEFVFTCLDGTEVDCSYRVPLFTTDSFTPKFLNTNIVLSIPRDWNTDKAINKNQVIMAFDEDTSFSNSELRFAIDPESIDIKSTPLWPGDLPPEGKSYYMLDLYLPAMVLPDGDQTFTLTAESTFRRGNATVTLTIFTP